LDEDKAQLFHHLVAKLLYLSRRSRQDIQTAVAFLCTRVQSPDMDDYKKLAKVMKYPHRKRAEVVGGQLLRSTPRHEKSQWDIYDPRKRHSVCSIKQAKAKHEELHGSRIGGH